MADGARLHLVDPETGEAHPSSYANLSPSELVALHQRKDRELDGWRLRCGRLEKELEEQETEQASYGEIHDLLEHCHKVTGRTKAKIVAGSARWNAVKKMRKHFEINELKAVPFGAMKNRWFTAQRHRLDAKELYKTIERVEELRDLGLGVVHRQLPNGLTLPPEVERRLSDLHPSEFSALDRCDCGHLQLVHAKNLRDGPTLGWWPCTRQGCDCVDFDDTGQRSDAWLAEQRKLRAEGRQLSEVAEAALRLKGAA